MRTTKDTQARIWELGKRTITAANPSTGGSDIQVMLASQ
jgi:hypothetical protein